MASRPPPDHTLFDALPCLFPSRRYNQAYNQTGCIRGASLEGSSCTRGREATTKTKVLPRESLFGGHSDDLRVRTGKNGPQILVTPPRGPSGTENGVSGAHLWYEQIDDSKPHYHNYQPNSQQVII